MVLLVFRRGKCIGALGAGHMPSSPDIDLVHTKMGIPGPLAVDADAGIPPTIQEVRAGRPLTHHQGIRGPIEDIRQAGLGIFEQDPIPRRELGSIDPQVRGGGHPDWAYFGGDIPFGL